MQMESSRRLIAGTLRSARGRGMSKTSGMSETIGRMEQIRRNLGGAAVDMRIGLPNKGDPHGIQDRVIDQVVDRLLDELTW